MQLTIDIPDKGLIELGKDAIEQEIQSMLKWLRIKQAFHRISEGLKSIDAQLYNKDLEEIRKSSWEEYKQGLGL